MMCVRRVGQDVQGRARRTTGCTECFSPNWPIQASEFLIYFVKVITVIVCRAPIKNC